MWVTSFKIFLRLQRGGESTDSGPVKGKTRRPCLVTQSSPVFRPNQVCPLSQTCTSGPPTPRDLGHCQSGMELPDSIRGLQAFELNSLHRYTRRNIFWFGQKNYTLIFMGHLQFKVNQSPAISLASTQNGKAYRLCPTEPSAPAQKRKIMTA